MGIFLPTKSGLPTLPPSPTNRTIARLKVKSYYYYLSCCSFFTSCSREWKSIDSKPTILLTTSKPDKYFNVDFRNLDPRSLESSGEHKAIRTRAGKTGRRSDSLHFPNVSMSTLCMASKTWVLTGAFILDRTEDIATLVALMFALIIKFIRSLYPEEPSWASAGLLSRRFAMGGHLYIKLIKSINVSISYQ